MLAVGLWDAVVTGVVHSALSDSNYIYWRNINYERTIYHYKFWNRPCSEHVVSPDVSRSRSFPKHSAKLWRPLCVCRIKYHWTSANWHRNEVIYLYDDMWRHTTFCMWGSFGVGTNVKREAKYVIWIWFRNHHCCCKIFFFLRWIELNEGSYYKRSVMKITVVNISWLNQEGGNGWGIQRSWERRKRHIRKTRRKESFDRHRLKTEDNIKINRKEIESDGAELLYLAPVWDPVPGFC